MKGKVKRIVSCLLLAATILSSCVQPFTAYAEESDSGQLVPGVDQDVVKEDMVVTVGDKIREIETVAEESADNETEKKLEESADDETRREPEGSADDETEQEPEGSADDEELLMFAIDTTMARRSSGTATLERGRKISYPGDLGHYSTCFYTINGKIAYCLESAKNSPSSDDYAYSVLESNEDLQKALYYGYGGPGDITEEYMPTFNEDMKYVFTHIAASYFYSGLDGFEGCTMEDLDRCGALGWIRDLAALDTPPSPSLNLTKTALKASYDSEKERQETGVTTLEGDYRNYITLNLPDDVTYRVEGSSKKQTGGSVKIYGDTSFYFTAPMTVSGNWDTGNMKGSIRNIWKAIVVSTGDSSQDIGSYYEEEGGSSVSFSVEWMNLAKVKVIKVDSSTSAKLSGAVFGLYRDEACTDLITTMPATDANGASEVEIARTQNTVYLKEITAPAGYRYNTTAYHVALTVNQTASVTVPDVEQLGNLTIYKEGEVLRGASSNADGTVFQYEGRRQKGAVYNVYAGADITTPYGAVVYRAGDLVAENLTTGNDGSVILQNLHLGTYNVTEMHAPKNFYNPKESKKVTLSYAGQTAEAVFSNVTFQNDRQKVKVSIVKKDKDTLNVLPGGIFGLYAAENITNADGTVVVNKDTLIQKVTTDKNGNASFTADLPIGFGYYVKEMQAPENYLRNTDDVYSFRFAYTHDGEATVSFTHTFVNERVNAAITLYKKDLETKKSHPQGDASLESAVYGLYARKNIVHPDGKTGVLYKAGEQVGTLTTDKEGKSKIENLYLGEYFVKEITPSVGYLADETEYDLVCSYEGDLVATVKRDCTSLEQVKKQPFQIIKAANNGETDAGLLAGAGFSAYLVSSLKVKEDGSYDFQFASPVVIGENGATEIFSDERGYACSIALPYGTYLVRETTTPHNYKPVKDFLVRITEHMPTTPQVWRVLLDNEFSAKLKIVKQDDETKKPVLAKNTEFKLYDLDRQEYVEQVTTYPTVVTHTSYFTDEQGYLILPQNLKIGRYRIEEVQAPFGYTLNENYYEIDIDSDTPYQVDGVSADVIVEVVYENHPVKGELDIVKRGEVLSALKEDFIYEVENLEGAVFEVYAAEDICTADFQKDEEWNRILEYASGDLVATLITDVNGEAHLDNLPLGTYKVVETKAPDGYVLNESEQTVTFAYADQKTPVIEQTVTFENDRQKVEISVVKKDAKTKAVVEGAVFGLYAKDDILAHGEVIAEADMLLGEAVTEADGKAVFDLDVPFGEYYIRELKAPAGYVYSDEAVEVTATYQGQDVQVVPLLSEFQNEPTTVSVKKTDLTTGAELSGATLTVLDQDGRVVDTWQSVKGEEHIMEHLVTGQTYTLKEEFAPYGYLQAQEITFTVEDTAEIQKLEMKDDVPTGLLLINKKGEFLEKVSLLERLGGWVAHLFEYVTGSLKDVTFEVYALEDIKAADGESSDYYKKDELVAEITTDDTGHARLENLPLGKYYVKEKETVEGYILDGEIREIDLTYRDQNMAVVTFSTDWQNNRQKVKVTVIKKEKDTDRVLEGAVFALCAKEDIINAGGKTIMKADTIIEERMTGEEGKLVFEADLPIGFSYYVKETVPAPGFATSDEVREFDFTYEDAETEIVFREFTFEDKPTVFTFTKVSLTDGKELEGAKLQITDEDGKPVEEWVSGKEPHTIKELVGGKTYTLTEIMPPDGYVTAESIKFTVEDTGEVQKVEMKDDVTKAEISKTDIAGKELPGAKLEILDEDGNVVESWTSEKKPHYIEMLPIGKYTLHEETAPDGYLLAEDVEFEVKDSGEVQKVVMVDECKPVIPEVPKTGDNSHLMLWMLLAGLAFAGLSVTAFCLTRKRRTW